MNTHQQPSSKEWVFATGASPDVPLFGAILYNHDTKEYRTIEHHIQSLLTSHSEAIRERVISEFDIMIKDAPPANYEEDNYDAGVIEGLHKAKDDILALLTDK